MTPYRSELIEHHLKIYPAEKIATALRKLSENWRFYILTPFGQYSFDQRKGVGITRPVASSAPEKVEQVKSSQRTAANIHTDALLQKTKFATDFGRCETRIHRRRTITSLLHND
ncbi:tRNA-specific 2-thiouridylase MnmA [Trichinella spiralis]|uniref:tRNA-specific 2-thiouridylase MnmA n=1 Tax=Trichinella spiralis TaxID=6334 RepID=A0ABR3KNQ8_TRISP